MNSLVHALGCAFFVAMTALPASGQERLEKISDRIGFSPILGRQIPLEAEFRRHDGALVPLRSFFRNRPVVIVPVYYRCPMLCGLELKGLMRCLRGLTLKVGQDFDIVTFSIDPNEGHELAAQKRKLYLAELGQPDAESGWHFLTGERTSIDRTCQALGFRSEFDPRTRQYAHAAGLVICTPDGRIARCFYGVEFLPRDLKLGLVDASQGTIGTLTDHIQLYCYMYDPTTGKYGIAILALVRLAGVLTAALLSGSVVWMLFREHYPATFRRKELVSHG